jgi:hypothetical protein
MAKHLIPFLFGTVAPLTIVGWLLLR